MYLKDVIILNKNSNKYEMINAGDLEIESQSSFDVMISDDIHIFDIITFSFEFRMLPHTRRAIGFDFDLTEKYCYNIAYEQLKMYEYKAIDMPGIARIFVYRIPHTFTIAYNWTTLISASMRANLYAMYWRLDCKDVMRVITSHLFNTVKYDYSLYTCANK